MIWLFRVCLWLFCFPILIFYAFFCVAVLFHVSASLLYLLDLFFPGNG